MNWLMFAFTAALFYAFVPGVFVRLPPGGTKMVVTAVHAALFALVLHFTRRTAESYLGREGFKEKKVDVDTEDHKEKKTKKDKKD
jgi:uncharacterized membrane protein YhiD involved in acid resistance